MNKIMYDDLAKKFKIDGNILGIHEYGNGLINRTFLLITENNKYILQKINKNVFKNPNLLMENVELVTKYINMKNGSTIKLIKTIDNKNFLLEEGQYFRCYEMKQNTVSYENIPNLKVALEVGKIMSNFQYILKDFDVKKINITIPYFHDLRHRYIDLIKAYRNNLNVERKKESLEIVNYVLKEYKKVMRLPILIEQERIEKRVCHYDTKLNNFLFNNMDKTKSCLIDLDTVMAGCSLYDYGDNIRNSIVSVKEDEHEKEIEIDFKKFANITVGYLSLGKNYLSKLEINYLIESIKVIVLELSIRFLTDYLNNDIYFKIENEKQNLYRSICQLNIYKNIKSNSKKLEKIVSEIYKRIK